jgi:hypothetical protein
MADKITQVRIGKNLIGLHGLEEIFQEILRHSWASAAEAQEELLQRVAAKNYLPRGSQPDYRQALWREFCRFRGEEVEAPTPAGLEIQVLGLGCMGCQHFYQQVLNILAAKGIEAGVQYITDPQLLKDYAVRAFPALVVNGQVILAGRVPPPVELEGILMEAGRKFAPGGQGA